MSDSDDTNKNEWSGGWGEADQPPPPGPPSGPPSGSPPTFQPGPIPPGGQAPFGPQGQPPPSQGQPPPFGPSGGQPGYAPPPTQPGYEGQPAFGPPPGAPPGYGQGPPGQSGFTAPPQQKKSNTGVKILIIVLVIIGVLILAGILAAVFIFRSAENVVGDISDNIEQFDEEFNFDDEAAVPNGPRLLDETGGLSGSDDTQQFQFTVDEARQIQIDVVAIDTIDPVVALMDSDGNEIERNDDGGQGLDSRINQMLEPGDYSIEVSQFGGGEGEFQVTVTEL